MEIRTGLPLCGSSEDEIIWLVYKASKDVQHVIPGNALLSSVTYFYEEFPYSHDIFIPSFMIFS